MVDRVCVVARRVVYSCAGGCVSWSFWVSGWDSGSAFLVRLRLDFLVVLPCKLFNMECRLFSISLVVVLFGCQVVRGGVGRHSTELEVT